MRPALAGPSSRNPIISFLRRGRCGRGVHVRVRVRVRWGVAAARAARAAAAPAPAAAACCCCVGMHTRHRQIPSYRHDIQHRSRKPHLRLFCACCGVGSGALGNRGAHLASLVGPAAPPPIRRTWAEAEEAAARAARLPPWSSVWNMLLLLLLLLWGRGWKPVTFLSRRKDRETPLSARRAQDT